MDMKPRIVTSEEFQRDNLLDGQEMEVLNRKNYFQNLTS